MMQYDFYIETVDGMKNSTVTSTYDFSTAPFGVVPYGERGSCTDSQSLLDDFWRCVDDVLAANNLTSSQFIRAVKAYSDGKLYGEYDG